MGLAHFALFVFLDLCLCPLNSLPRYTPVSLTRYNYNNKSQMLLVCIGYDENTAEIPLFLLPVALITPFLHLCHVHKGTGVPLEFLSGTE